MFEKQIDRTGYARGPTATRETDRADVGALLNQCLEAVANSAASKASQELERQMPPLQSKIEQLATALEEIQKSQRMLDSQLQGLIAHSQLLERASQEHAQLSEEHYQRRIVEPMCRLLFPAVNVLDKALRLKSVGEGPTHGARWTVVEQIQVYLVQFFSAHDIKPIRSTSGTPLNPKVMKPVRFIPCPDKDLDGLVAGSLEAGFIRGTDRVLRFESVALYRYKESAQNLPNENKETSHGSVN